MRRPGWRGQERRHGGRPAAARADPPGTHHGQLELDGADARGLPFEERKARLAELLAGAGAGVRHVEHYYGEGDVLFEHACKMGLEGTVSKRRDLPYYSGRSNRWVKVRNPNSLAVRRLVDEAPS